ncbi:MAG: arginine repressor [Clostridia bacterium]|nr:arginine repressor [Clostridia bacterium]
MKSERQAKILEMISKYEIQTQEEITERLKADGFKVTQATVSRDLRDLKLTKHSSSTGKYKYTVIRPHDHTGMVRLNNTMLESIVGVRYSMNNVVIKTYPGLAQAVASSVDALNIDTILGCVAGDDTIIIVTEDEESSAEINAKLREMMKTY